MSHGDRALPPPSWRLRRRQLREVVRLELRKVLASPRAAMLYLLAAMPVAIGVLYFLGATLFASSAGANPARHELVFIVLYHSFVVRIVLFVGCLWIFMNLYRGDLIDKSLHFYYLAPVRREVVLLGKWLAGLAGTAGVLMTAVLLTYVSVLLPAGGAGLGHLLRGKGLLHLAGFELTTLFGCLGYGALFLLLGMLTRNPILPGLLIWGWEQINIFLPPLLKRLSVIHYLQAFAPLPPADAPIEILAERVAPWPAAAGLAVVSALLLWAAAARARRIDIVYSGD